MQISESDILLEIYLIYSFKCMQLEAIKSFSKEWFLRKKFGASFPNKKSVCCKLISILLRALNIQWKHSSVVSVSLIRLFLFTKASVVKSCGGDRDRLYTVRGDWMPQQAARQQPTNQPPRLSASLESGRNLATNSFSPPLKYWKKYFWSSSSLLMYLVYLNLKSRKHCIERALWFRVCSPFSELCMSLI